jgi:O-antigen/teichoic acid export membrane protein
LLGQVTVWTTILALGLPNGLLNVLLKHHGSDDRVAARQAIATVWWFLITITAVAVFAVCMLTPHVSYAHIFGVESMVSPATAGISTTVTILIALLGLPLAIVPQIFAASQRMHLSYLSGATVAVLQFGALFFAIFINKGLVGVVVLTGGAGLIAQIIFAWIAVSGPDRDLRPSWGRCSTEALRRIVALSVPLLLFQLGALALNHTQLMLLSQSAKPEVVVDYSILMRLYFPIAVLIQALTQSFFPALRDARERGELGWMRRSFHRVLFLRLGIVGGIAVVFLVAGNSIISFWLRSTTVQFEFRVWIAFAALLIISNWSGTYSDLLSICDRVWPLVAVVFANGVCTVLLTVFLAPCLEVFGALLAYSAFNIVVGCWMLPFVARSLLKLPSPVVAP